MNTAWTKGLKKGSTELKDVEEAFKASAFLRRKMLEVLEQVLKEELDKKLADAGYESPSWAYRQADSVGYVRAIERVKGLLTEK